VLVAAAEPVLAEGIAALIAEDPSTAALGTAGRAPAPPPNGNGMATGNGTATGNGAPHESAALGGWRLSALQTVTTIAAAEHALATYRPPLSVLVLDPPLAGVTTEEACARLVTAQPATAALVLLARPTPQRVRQICRSGARGVFETTVDPTTLVSALRQIDSGEVAIQPTLVQYLLGNIEPPPDLPSGDRLNARALTALQLLARGYTSKEIAPILGTTAKAVNLTIERACRQLHAATRSEAVAIAISRGLIS